MKKTLLIIFSALIYSCTPTGRDSSLQNIRYAFQNPKLPIQTRINDLLSRLTVEEKISLLYATAPAIPRLGIAKYYHGNEALHGVVRPGKFTVFPQAIGLAATWNPGLIHEVSTAISDEARGRWNELKQGREQNAEFSDLLAFWSPDLNLARDPRWGRTEETYGEDPYLSATLAISFIKGLQGDNPNYLKAVATPKHFTANNEEHNRFECNALMSDRSLREYYLVPFEAAIREGKAESIMSAYNAINGIPCTASKLLLTDILRKEWGFNGYVVSDCGAPGFLHSDHKYASTLVEAAVLAMNAGLDLECGGYCDTCHIYRDYLLKAYEQGLVSGTQIDSAAYRVLRARFKLGIFDPLELNPYNSIPRSIIGCKEHQELALETARQSIVLLKNSGNILPLNKNNIRSIAVVGPNSSICIFGGYSGTPLNEPVSVLQGITNRAGNGITVRHTKWIDSLDTGEGSFEEEKKLASSSDIVIAVLGIDQHIESEGLDKKNLDLPIQQQKFIEALVRANTNTIVVLIAGSPLTINWINEHVPAIVNAWYPGEQGGNAVADVIFGNFNPAGRLPLTYFKSTDDLLPFDDYEISNGRTYMYSEKAPLFPFGYGLSYSHFSYSSLVIDQKEVNRTGQVSISVNIKNTGPFDGDEVVQLYEHKLEATIKRPLKELKGFQRVQVKNGETKQVNFSLHAADLKFWDSRNKRWTVEPGMYEIYIGSSSADIRLKGKIEIK